MSRALPLAAILILVCLAVAPADAAVLWFSGFESGDASEWPTASGGFGITTGGAVRSGAYAGTGNPGAFVVSSAGFNQSTLGVRTSLFHVGTWSGNQNLVQVFDAALAHNLILRITSANKLAWALNDGANIATGSTTIADSTILLLDILFVRSATVGGVQVKINGVVEFTSLGTDTSSLTNIDMMAVGTTLSPGSSPAASDAFDDVMACGGAYCPSGRTIARQGTSGTPTYTSWTKTGTCSGGNIEDCWSATPFSTAAAATSIIASDAQTMLVATFGSTQSGHGSEVIAAGSTINACKTVLIATTAVSSGINIRRIIGGATTDTAKTLTTSDALYDDGIWTTTSAILRTSTNEIGAVHGTGVNLDTVEDAWLMCDFGAIGVPVKHRVTQ